MHPMLRRAALREPLLARLRVSFPERHVEYSIELHCHVHPLFDNECAILCLQSPGKTVHTTYCIWCGHTPVRRMHVAARGSMKTAQTSAVSAPRFYLLGPSVFCSAL